MGCPTPEPELQWGSIISFASIYWAFLHRYCSIMLRHMQIYRGGSCSYQLQPTQYLLPCFVKGLLRQQLYPSFAGWTERHYRKKRTSTGLQWVLREMFFCLRPPELEKFMSTVQYLCVKAGEAASPVPILSQSLWHCDHWPHKEQWNRLRDVCLWNPHGITPNKTTAHVLTITCWSIFCHGVSSLCC